MKVADIIKLLDGSAEVFIYDVSAWMDCADEMDSTDCVKADPVSFCQGCPDFVEKHTEWEKFHGSSDAVPIKLAEMKVVELNVKERVVGKRHGKEIKQPFLGIQVR